MTKTRYGFRSALDVTKLRIPTADQRPRWRMDDNLIFMSAILGLIIVPKGFITDFASVPRLPFAFWLFGDTAQASAVIHDWICTVYNGKNGNCKVSWTTCARVFNEAMKYEGISAWRRWAMVVGVRLGGITRDKCKGKGV